MTQLVKNLPAMKTCPAMAGEDPGKGPGEPGRPGAARSSPGRARCSSYDGDLSLPLGLALGSPIFPSGCEGKLRVALESLQGLRDLT